MTLTISVQFSQSLSHVWLFVTRWTAARQSSLHITNSWSLLKLTSIKSVMPSNHLILCYPLLLLPSIFASIKVFPTESAPCIRWPKYWSFSFSISPSNEHSGLTSFRMDWFELLAAQGTLQSRLQHCSSKHQFFSAQLILAFKKIISLTRPLMVPHSSTQHFRREEGVWLIRSWLERVETHVDKDGGERQHNGTS